MAPAPSSASDHALLPAEGDVPWRIQRALHLIPANGYGVLRRAVLFAGIAWLPIAIWALLADRFFPGTAPEPFLRQFSIHARCLIAIPLFVLAEATTAQAAARIIHRIRDDGFLAAEHRPRLLAFLDHVFRLRASVLPWVGVLAIVIVILLAVPTVEHNQDVLFTVAADGTPGHLTFGGLWYLFVARAIFLTLLLGWVWRILLWTYAFWGVSRLPLRLVPTHPDRMFGLAVLSRCPGGFWPYALALSTVQASVWAHDMLYEGSRIESYTTAVALFAGTLSLLLLLPMLVFVPTFLQARLAALYEYGTLLTRHGRLVDRKWIGGDKIGDEPILDSPELGPVADMNSLYQAVRAQLPAPINLVTLIGIALPIALPILAVAALQLPVKELLLKLLGSLV